MAKADETAVTPLDDLVADGEDESVQDPTSTEDGERGTAEDEAGIDWKTRAQEFEGAFKGLQGTVQKLVEEQRQTQAERAASEERALREKFESQLEGMTENEANFARRAFDLEMENRRLKAEKASTEPINQRLARDAILSKLSKDYGVAPAFLEQMVQKYNHPLAVAAAAEAAHATRKQLERPKGNGRVESSGGGSTGGDEAELTKLTNSGDWDAYWKLMDRQAERESRRR
jgi:hypothetical protein